MQHLTRDITDLLPIQDFVDEKNLRECVKQIKSRGYIPLPVIANRNYFLLGDGHHTASALFLLGERDIEINVFETDKEVINYNEGAFYGIDYFEFALNYFESSNRDLRNLGVFQISDLIIFPSLEEPRRLRDISL